MIRVMVVEDDKLTRRGIIASVAWDKFGMQIVCDVGTAVAALEYLRRHTVDLIITDIAMPVMSGMDLLREVKRLYPAVQVVILTMHQKFEYVQEALRLGALDYIGKYQLEQEDVSDTIQKIAHRLKEAPAGGKAPAGLSRAGACYLWLSLTRQDEGGPPLLAENGLTESRVTPRMSLYYFSPEHPFAIDPEKERAFDLRLAALPYEDEMLLRLRDADNYGDDALLDNLPRELTDWFYLFHAGYGERSVAQLLDRGWDESLGSYRECKETLLALNWIFDANAFESVVAKLRQGRVPYAKTVHLLLRVFNEIQSSYGFLGCMDAVTIPDGFLCFDHAVAWLSGIAALVRSAVELQTYSPYVIECLRQAMRLIAAEYAEPLTSDDVSVRVHLSRSYFCQIFKKTMKVSFNHYLRNVRIEKAKELLTKMDMSIPLIAEKVGYKDEKYFCKLFRAVTGASPSVYRALYSRRR